MLQTSSPKPQKMMSAPVVRCFIAFQMHKLGTLRYIASWGRKKNPYRVRGFVILQLFLSSIQLYRNDATEYNVRVQFLFLYVIRSFHTRSFILSHSSIPIYLLSVSLSLSRSNATPFHKRYSYTNRNMHYWVVSISWLRPMILTIVLSYYNIGDDASYSSLIVFLLHYLY